MKRWIVRHLPAWLVTEVLVYAFAKATTGPWSASEFAIGSQPGQARTLAAHLTEEATRSESGTDASPNALQGGGA